MLRWVTTNGLPFIIVVLVYWLEKGIIVKVVGLAVIKTGQSKEGAI